MQCPNCQQFVTDGTPVCPHCGLVFSQQQYQQQPIQTQYSQQQSYQAQPYQAQPYQAQPYQTQQSYQAQPYQQPYQQPPYGGYPQPQPTNGKAVAALIVGIFAVIMSFIIPPVGILLAIIAIILGIVGNKPPDGKAKAGLIMGIISMVISVALLVLTIAGIGWLVGEAENGNLNISNSNINVNQLINDLDDDDFWNTNWNSNFSNGGNTPAPAANGFEGRWYLVEMNDGFETYDRDSMSTLYQMGFEMYIDIAPGGKMTLSVLGETGNGTWSAVSDTEATADFGAGQSKLTLNGDELRVAGIDGSTIVCSRSKP